ncbi:MAG: hypothetical protein AAF494_02895 [Pseudomonadota bacterium]
MKSLAVAAALAVSVVASPAYADGHAEKSTAEEAEMAALTIETPIEQLMADEQAAAVLEKHLPGVSQHPAYDQFKAMTLVQLKPWSQGMITDETLEKIAADLEALGSAVDQTA